MFNSNMSLSEMDKCIDEMIHTRGYTLQDILKNHCSRNDLKLYIDKAKEEKGFQDKDFASENIVKARCFLVGDVLYTKGGY